MRRAFSRMTPRTRKFTSTVYRRHDVDRRRRVLLRCRQHAESRRTVARPRPRTFLDYDSPPQTRPRHPPRCLQRRDPVLQPFRRPCASRCPMRSFLLSDFDENDTECSCGHHLWRSRSGIIPSPARIRKKPNTSGSVSASHALSFTSSARCRCTGSRGAHSWNAAPQEMTTSGLNGARTHRAGDVQPSRPISASTVGETTAPAAPTGVVSDGLGLQYRKRSYRYSRLHRRTIDALVPEELRRLPQQWAVRAAQQTELSSSN